MRLLTDGSAAISYQNTGIGAYTETLIKGLEKHLMPGEKINIPAMGKIYSVPEFFSLIPKTTPDFWQLNHRQSQNILFSGFDVYHNTQNGLGMLHGIEKNIVTVHDLIPLLFPQYCGSPYKELFCENCLKNAAAADAVITVSEQSKQDLINIGGIPPSRITVIYEAPKECFYYKKNAETYIHRKYRIKTPFFLYVGGFNMRKNLSGILKAMKSFVINHRNYLLVIPSKDSPRCRKFRESAEKSSLTDYMRFPSYVSDRELSYFYSACTALIYPSFYEGFGLPPLEAAACGAPTILSNIPVHKEIMADAALYINPGNPQSIAEAMAFIAEDTSFRQKIAKAAYQQSKLYSVTNTVKQTLEIYRKVCR